MEKQILKVTQAKKGEAPENPLDWYVLTETTNSILNELIAYIGREEFEELQKVTPDYERMKELNRFSEELEAINSEPGNFKNVSRMREIIDKYAPKLKLVYDAA